MTPEASSQRHHRMGLAARCLVLAVAGLGATGCDSFLTPVHSGSVKVSAVRRNGVPIPGVKLLLYNGFRHMAVGVTDARGVYRFEQVPSATYGVYAYEKPEGFTTFGAVTGAASSDIIDRLTVGGIEEPSAKLVFLKVGPGTLVATVAQADGRPFPGVQATIRNVMDKERSAVTDSNGHATFSFTEFGKYLVYAVNPDRVFDQAQPLYLAVFDVLVEEGDTETVLLKTLVCTGTLSVQVQDDVGAAVSGFPVQLYLASGALRTVNTATNGAVAFGPLPCADYGVTLQPRAGWTFVNERGSGFMDGLSVRAGSTQAAVLKAKRTP